MVKTGNIKPVGAARLERELNSGAFLAGLKTVANYTHRTGKEAGFTICYVPECDLFVYPEHILIGTPYDMGNPHRTKVDSILTGLKSEIRAARKANRSFSKVYNLLQKMSAAKKGVYLDFPADLFFNRESYAEYRRGRGVDNEQFPVYAAIRVHSHPDVEGESDLALSPSAGDLNCLYKETSIANSEVFEYGNGAIVPLRPISIIVSPKKQREGKTWFNNLFALQQNPNVTRDFCRIETQFYALRNGYPKALANLSEEERTMLCLFSEKNRRLASWVKYDRGFVKEVLDGYNFCDANFVYSPENRLADASHLSACAGLERFCKGAEASR